MVSIFFPYKCLISNTGFKIFLLHGNVMILILIILMPHVTYVKGLYMQLLYCSSVNTSQESCLGTIENNEHTKDIYN